MTTFSAEETAALTSLLALWDPQRVVLIGGAALGALTGMPWRVTLDLDLVTVAHGADALDALHNHPEWTKDPHVEPRWKFRQRVPVDVVCVTRESLEAGRLTWPASGVVFDLTGLDLALKHATPLVLDNGHALRVAPLPVIVLLKMVSFLDRPRERRRDLADIAWTMHGYVGELDERRFEPRFNDLGVTYDETPAFLLGEDLRTILSSAQLQLVHAFLAQVEGRHADDFAASGPPTWNRSAAQALRQLAAFRRGLGGPGG